MGRPLVYLIGAGPGDPGLITVKGLDCVAKADVVIYDYLANPRLLSSADPDAELIYVGKKGWHEHLTQHSMRLVSSSRSFPASQAGVQHLPMQAYR